MTNPPITVDSLGKSFSTPDSGVRKVLSTLSFTVKSSERVAVLGPSGAGKTTLLRIVAGLEEPDEGTVMIGGDREAPLHTVAMVSQEANLFPWLTVERNITFPLEAKGIRRDEARSRVSQVLEITQMSGYRDLYPSELSGGMKQRVAFGRAIVLDPAVLLLDEPFGALDAIAREEIQEEFLGWWRLGRPTTVLITHSAEEAAFLADKILFFVGGHEPTFKTLDFREDPLTTFDDVSVKDYRTTGQFYERVSRIRKIGRA